MQGLYPASIQATAFIVHKLFCQCSSESVANAFADTSYCRCSLILTTLFVILFIWLHLAFNCDVCVPASLFVSYKRIYTCTSPDLYFLFLILGRYCFLDVKCVINRKTSKHIVQPSVREDNKCKEGEVTVTEEVYKLWSCRLMWPSRHIDFQ
jgi:hypothetical protein